MTPIYNRRKTIERAMRSVERQTLRDIEYIIIDDGSTESADDLLEKFMDSTKLPVMYIKKENGGVHTARNVGYKQARGELILCIDSDDELLPEACEIFMKTWKSIPNKDEVWQIKAQCINEKGEITGATFPKGINEMPIEEARKCFSMAKGEQIGCRSAKIMKENLFPEPEGVTFVREGILWVPLEKKYRSWGINDVVRIYHTEGDDHLSSSKGRSNQDLRNEFWNLNYILKRPEVFKYGTKRRAKNVVKREIVRWGLVVRGDWGVVRK